MLLWVNGCQWNDFYTIITGIGHLSSCQDEHHVNLIGKGKRHINIGFLRADTLCKLLLCQSGFEQFFLECFCQTECRCVSIELLTFRGSGFAIFHIKKLVESGTLHYFRDWKPFCP